MEFGRVPEYELNNIPWLIIYLVDKMNKEIGLNLVKPKFINDAGRQKGLFGG